MMKTCTMYYTDERGNVLAIRENVTETDRLKLISDDRWVTAFWSYWEKAQ